MSATLYLAVRGSGQSQQSEESEPMHHILRGEVRDARAERATPVPPRKRRRCAVSGIGGVA